MAGASAGLTATICTYPFDYIRTAFAANKEARSKSLLSFVARTYKKRGASGFYAGLSPAVTSIVPLMGLNFMAYEAMTQVMLSEGRNGQTKHS